MVLRSYTSTPGAFRRATEDATMAGMEVDFARLADKARINAAVELREAQAMGASLYTADVDGNVFELTPDGHVFAVELRGDRLTRIREVA
jgi:hypothetical protein